MGPVRKSKRRRTFEGECFEARDRAVAAAPAPAPPEELPSESPGSEEKSRSVKMAVPWCGGPGWTSRTSHCRHLRAGGSRQ